MDDDAPINLILVGVGVVALFWAVVVRKVMEIARPEMLREASAADEGDFGDTKDRSSVKSSPNCRFLRAGPVMSILSRASRIAPGAKNPAWNEY